MNSKNYHALVSELQFFRNVRFWKSLHSKDHVVVHFVPWNWHTLHFSCILEKAWNWIEIFFTCQTFNCKKYNPPLFEFTKKHNVSYFELKILQHVRFQITFSTHVRFWIENFTLCQFLSEILLQFAKFSCVNQNKPCFGNVLVWGVSSVGQVILLRQALCLRAVINVTRHIETANPIRLCSSIYLDKEWYLTRFYYRLWECNVQI